MSKLKMNQRVPNKNADLRKKKKISLMGTELAVVQASSLFCIGSGMTIIYIICTMYCLSSSKSN